MNELKPRKIDGFLSKIWFEYTTPKGHYSVVDFGELMKTSITYETLKKAGLFMGWEAMILGEDGGVKGDPIRADSWEELEKKLQ